VAQGDTEVAKQDLTIVTLQRDRVRQKLVTFRTSVASFSAKGGVIEVIRRICRHLTQLAREPDDFCDSAHCEYRYITHCGTLVCSDCLRQAVPGIDEMTSSAQSGDRLELDCPWCRADFWSWEPLAVPYSSTWIRELECAADVMNGWILDGLLEA
jgi:hypothetical protein